MSDPNQIPAGAAGTPGAVPAAAGTPGAVPGATDPPPYVPPAAAVPPGGTPGYSGGGSPSSGNVLSRFFEGITVADVVMVSLSLCALFLMIKYYRDKIKSVKEDRSILKDKIDQLETTVNNIQADGGSGNPQ